MKVFVHRETGEEVSVSDSNLFSIYEREGYEDLDLKMRKQEEKAKKQAEKERLATEKLAKEESEKNKSKEVKDNK
ncbi:hypothetical protein [Clostridium sp. LP20]|uniref:hypothetical protein n=1 Tax=Clostridium sp. LP20 TaxID=3418665 RepID=UPI003EE688D0